ncbi:hypothetical protein SAMN04488029_0915 [Reichenbachiella faecimaris]|uniref:ABM domain-containing protein n=1 Tax=Reichenbachiella faecimaris TaxID=692418 RepID=A0A1W2G7C4_REIFA|nr:hypothetical protein [Reichenbachiella faecimaris]SMD32567.1 hypothetical protein SAMN04488029_0915 [Reichenbachiella faecimaris]
MYRVIWRYRVESERIKDFLKVYDSKGDWVQLFSKSPDYVKTELFCETETNQMFITIDYWTSKEAYQEFYKKHKKEVDLIDALGDNMTSLEERVAELMT